MTMPETNTVTITLNEYMDMREKAQMNGFLMNELGRMEARFRDIERMVFDLRSELERKCGQ
jgi:hypothetical protein